MTSKIKIRLCTLLISESLCPWVVSKVIVVMSDTYRMLKAVDKSTYNSNILLGVGNHLQNMSKVFRAAKLKLDLSAPRDVIHSAEYISSTHKTLDQLELNLDEMEMILDEMEVEPPKSTSGSNFPPVLLLVTTSLIGICLSAFITLKLAR